MVKQLRLQNMILQINTFTDYVDRFNSVQMGINYSIYMDADTIPVSKTMLSLMLR